MMATVNWTSDQLKAIEGRKGTMLVSAAAGSGKTAVLVERVIRRLCDPEEPCGVENLLIVTFTNAAAAQMKEKIYKAISNSIALDPQNKELRRQQLMLPFASICTIDSFCIGLVRENFHALGVAPDFALLDEGRLAILRSNAANKIIDELYEKNTPQFKRLCELMSNSRDDKKLYEMILKLYDLSQAYPFPEEWLNSLAGQFENPDEIEDGKWGKQLIGFMNAYVSNTIKEIKYCLQRLAEEPELSDKFSPVFIEELSMFEKLSDALLNGKWEDIQKAYASVTFGRMTSPRKYESEVKELCKNVREAYKDSIDLFADFLSIGREDHKQDLEALAPVVRELINAVISFGREFTRLKQDENSADFSDTLHLALKLLVERDENGNCVKTELARELSKKYAEILVDEYQDVNLAQDMIFSAVSKNESNLFMVGDVKQSIYGFRQAMPEIFLKRRDSLAEYETGVYPAKVTLGKNFRSRSGVTEIVNFIFSSVMSRNAGGLDYDRNEFLEAAAAYPEKDGPDTELYIFEKLKDGEGNEQANFVAEYIENAVKNGMTVSNGDGTVRNAKYKDFCILLRSVKNNSQVFIDALTERGIPVECDASEAFIDSPEIMFMTSLLKVVDNPVDDVALVCIMLSPVFGFSPDELSDMRAEHRDGSIYHCIVHASENGNEKARDFLERTDYFRRIAANVRAGELVRRLIEETGYGAIVNAMKDSDKRRANLNKFIDFANGYERTGKTGVSGFIRYVDKILKSGNSVSVAGGKTRAADAVSIMTIHKSKGLEFPVCFIGMCEKTYGEPDLKEDLIISPESGIGIRTDIDGVRYDTLSRRAAYFERRTTDRSEEIRVLYVALTRPKEKLILLSTYSDAGKRLAKLASKITADDERLDPWSVMSMTSYADLILTALLRHPDAHALRMSAGVSNAITLECKTGLKAEIIGIGNETRENIESDDANESSSNENTMSEETTAVEETMPEEETEEAEALLNEIKNRLEYEYPFAALDGVVAKRIASKLGEKEFKSEYFASARPSFMSKNSLTPAQRGIATHRFMQFSDYAEASINVEAELERLVKDGMLTQAEADAVDSNAIAKFFSSDLARRILASEKVYKEFAFTCSIPVCEMYPELEGSVAENEVVIVEGVTDCAFVENGKLVIVDYKTDRAENAEQLVSEYSEQLMTYRRCLSEVLDMEVKETLIYSFKLGETVAIDN